MTGTKLLAKVLRQSYSRGIDMDTSRTNHRTQRNASARKQDAIRSNPARHGIVEPEPLANSDFAFVTEVIVFPPELPVHGTLDDSRFGTVVVSLGKEPRRSASQEPLRNCNGCGFGCNNGGTHGGLFDNLGPKPSKTNKLLRHFNEICTELENGATSMRQIAERLKERRREHDYPLDLPLGLAGVFRGVKAALKLFQDLFGLEEKPHIFTYDPSKSNAVTGLTDFGRSLWRDTRSFLMSRGDI